MSGSTVENDKAVAQVPLNICAVDNHHYKLGHADEG